MPWREFSLTLCPDIFHPTLYIFARANTNTFAVFFICPFRFFFFYSSLFVAGFSPVLSAIFSLERIQFFLHCDKRSFNTQAQIQQKKKMSKWRGGGNSQQPATMIYRKYLPHTQYENSPNRILYLYAKNTMTRCKIYIDNWRDITYEMIHTIYTYNVLFIRGA